MKKAKCYTQLKDLKQANDYYMMAIEIQPNNYKPYYKLAKLKIKIDEIE